MTELEQLKLEIEAKKQDELEALKKEYARINFKGYIDNVFEGYIWTKWNRILCRLLNRIEKSEISFLLLEVSPRWGKTELVAKQFPAYVIGKNAKKKMMVVSYADVLATESARHSYDVLKENNEKDLFKVDMSTKKEAGNWETKIKGGYYSAGLGGSITGKGFDIGIIDDYVKNSEDADSLTIREKTWEWYGSTFKTRDEKSIQKRTSIIVFATRWNVDDLGGRILQSAKDKGKNIVMLDMESDEELLEKQVDALEYEDVVEFKVPALNKADETNYPERFTTEQLLDIKHGDQGMKVWEAMYMQDPMKAGGVVFKKETFKYFAMSDIKWKDYSIAIHIDPAWSTKKTSDDVAIAVTARHKVTREIYEIDLFADTILPSEAYSYIVNTAERWKQFTNIEFISVEKVTLSKKQGEWITGFETYLREQGRFYTILYHEPRGQGQKKDRIKNSLEPMFNRGAIHFRCDDTNNRAWSKQELQLLKFPVAPHDDLADVLCQGVIMWEGRGDSSNKTSVNAMAAHYGY